VLLATKSGMTPFVRGTYDLDIGGGSNYFSYHGSLDDFRVWNIALSQAQIQANLGVPLTGSESNLVVYYRFDNSGGTVATNGATATGALYNGAIKGGAPSIPSGVLSSVVTTNTDNGPGSLRQAIADASPGTTITFTNSLSGKTILLTNGQFELSNNVTIDASALTNGIQINGNGISRIFEVDSGVTVVLNSLTITNGYVPNASYPTNSGGGILNFGKLTLNACALQNNKVGSGSGGGIENSGGVNGVATLTVSNCTFADNTSYIQGGGIDNYFWYSPSTLSAINCTFSGNSSTFGGAIENGGSTITMTQCTIVSNLCGRSGGGIDNDGFTLVDNCILAGNIVASGTGPDLSMLSGTFTATNCLVGDGTSSSLVDGASGNQVGTSSSPIHALLAPLGNYGGSTPTMPPLPGSPAIDAGAATTLTTDQRGFPRVAGPAVDIGAVEFQANPVMTAADVIAGSLRYAITYVTNNATITFDPSLSGQTIVLTNGQMTLTQNVTIDGSALPNAIAINGNHASRLFAVNGGVSAVLNTLMLTNGYAVTGSAGGAVVNSGTLTVNNCTLAGNASTVASIGGGAIHNSGTLIANNSTFVKNQSANVGGAIGSGNSDFMTINQCTVVSNSAASGGGGGIYNNGGTLDLTNSIVAGNSPLAQDIGNSATFNQAGNVFNLANPQLAPLGNYGGTTPTMPPLPGSPAIDHAVVSALVTDQRGFLRPVGPAPDIGAVEVQSPAANPPVLGNITRIAGGSNGHGIFQFIFTNAPATDFTVLTSTNLALPLANWIVLGEVLQPVPGQYQFTDAKATTNTLRFYRVISP
jgi:fibronectin-binding autotransporter adhesin